MTPNEKKIDKVFANAAADAAKDDYDGSYEPSAIRRMAKGPHRYAAAIELDFTHLNGCRGYWDRTGRVQGITVRLGIPSYGEEDEEYAQNCLDTMVEIAEKLGIPVKRSYKRLQSTIHGPIYNCYVVVPQYEPQAGTEPEASDEVDESGASAISAITPAINESTKVTLTFGQLKRLVKEETRAERLGRLAMSRRLGRGDSKAKAEMQWIAYQKNLDRITKCCVDHDDLGSCSVRDLIEVMGVDALIVSSVNETGKVGILSDNANNLDPTEFEEAGLGEVGIGYVVNGEAPNDAVIDAVVFSSGPEIAFCEGELGPNSFTKEEYLNDPASYQDIFRAVQGLADGLEAFFTKVAKAIDEIED